MDERIERKCGLEGDDGKVWRNGEMKGEEKCLWEAEEKEGM